MYSLLNNSLVKGLLFIAGILIVTFINNILKTSLKSLQNSMASPFCNVLPNPFTVKGDNNVFDSPSLNSTLIGFTTSMLLFPMYQSKTFNAPLLVFLISLLCINGAVEVHANCTKPVGILLGTIVGVLFGILYYSAIKLSGNDELAYFSEESSNNIQCSKPSKQQFRCKTLYRSKPSLGATTAADAITTATDADAITTDAITTP
jgi:hypothetical protein